MKTVAFVPIKMNNERLLGKNTKSFDNGEPLIYYILNTLSSVFPILLCLSGISLKSAYERKKI
jgi:CMP-N-acetylneuraminic acid synthetase